MKKMQIAFMVLCFGFLCGSGSLLAQQGPCGPECTCGCHEGKPCRCGDPQTCGYGAHDQQYNDHPAAAGH